MHALAARVQVVEFYKAWDRYGALSNFSAHAVRLPGGPVSASGALPRGPERAWRSVEHFYQAQKLAGGGCCARCDRCARLSYPAGRLLPRSWPCMTRACCLSPVGWLSCRHMRATERALCLWASRGKGLLHSAEVPNTLQAWSMQRRRRWWRTSPRRTARRRPPN